MNASQLTLVNDRTMKAVASTIGGLLSSLAVAIAGADYDPFAEPPPQAEPRPQTQSIEIARAFVQDEMLLAFDEQPFGKASPKQNGGFCLMRAFVDLQAKYPTMLKLRESDQSPSGRVVEMKQIIKKNGRWVFWSSRTTRLSVDQWHFFMRVWKEADPLRLPIADWNVLPGMLDGDNWVYEFYVREGSITMVRDHPLSAVRPILADKLDVQRDRLSREGLLNSIVAMLWIVSGK